ncbi:Rieske 2Fe-2S domain-containing protein [Cryptosporangium sp. NPDC051539]|uniref:Rieske 2Fe-2S domain-containing protein n=1 Tax=Cryptosporangium sp. NPDC051539 TaxID=3363962 RepID=UPI00379282E2
MTGLGHASALIETAHGSVLCDPWVNPAYFGSWFPFPDNSELDWDEIGKVDYLYVSHLHRDHYDPENLKRISKSATVLLPEYPTDELHDALHDLGFTKIFRTVNGEVHDLDGLKVMIQALKSPTDGPIGDSSLWLDDGNLKLLNQNDARPTELSTFAELGHVDIHMLQYSGAIWYPMVYELTDHAKQVFGEQKRARQFDRTIRYIDDLKASWIVPIAGPPCFLDEQLWQFNDLGTDPGNIFPDQQVFIDHLQEKGYDNGVLLLPGSKADFAAPGAPVEHPYEPSSVFGENKEQYLRAFQERKKGVLEAEKASWSHPEIDLFPALKEWIEPLLAQADKLAAGINGPVRFTAADAERGDVDLVIDFVEREVRLYDGERARYRFTAPRNLIEHLVAIHEIDWVNSLFLSCRFSAARVGPYNEYVYAFFKCLSEERLTYVEGWYAEQSTDDEDCEIDGWAVQRRCAHLKADLTRFGKVEDGVLTCQMHGWKWRLKDGSCLTSVGHPMRSRLVGEPTPAE